MIPLNPLMGVYEYNASSSSSVAPSAFIFYKGKQQKLHLYVSRQWDNRTVGVAGVDIQDEDRKHMFPYSLGKRPMASGTYMQSCLMLWKREGKEILMHNVQSPCVHGSDAGRHENSTNQLDATWCVHRVGIRRGWQGRTGETAFESFPLCHTSRWKSTTLQMEHVIACLAQ